MTFSYQPRIPGMPEDRSRRSPRRGSRDVFHAYMAKAVSFDKETGMPMMAPEADVPKGVISFSEAMNRKTTDFDQYVHFYEHDGQIERFWNDPWKYMGRLSRFSGFISPDYSSAPDMPKPLRMFNTYRNQLVGAWLQSLGYKVICNVRCPAYGHEYSLVGVPKRSVLAVGAVGCIKDPRDRHRFEGGLIRAIDEADPIGLVVVGEDAYGVFEYARIKGIPLYFHSGSTRKRYEEVRHVR